jgi:hypothetical protein
VHFYIPPLAFPNHYLPILRSNMAPLPCD